MNAKRMFTPFENDPFAMIWQAFKNLYPDKECSVWYDQHQNDQHDEEYGFTTFPNDGSIPHVYIFAEHDINIQSETLAHELAHVAVGVGHGHDDEWDAAFEAIKNEYDRLGVEMFGSIEEKEVENEITGKSDA